MHSSFNCMVYIACTVLPAVYCNILHFTPHFLPLMGVFSVAFIGQMPLLVILCDELLLSCNCTGI